MELDDLCKVLQLLKSDKNEEQDNGPWIIGKKYFIRTVTMYLTGELISVSSQELVLKDAAWIADAGRLNESVKDPSKFNEIEPFAAPVIVGRGSIVDATEMSSIITMVK